MILPLSRTIVPDTFTTNLKFIDSSHTVLNNSGLTYATIRFRPSSAYDIDPTLGSTSVPGFNEWASFYGRYRVLSSKINVHFSNLEKVPINAYIWPSNYDLGANYVFLAASIASPFSTHTVLGPITGLDSKVLSKRIRSDEIFGSNEVFTDQDFGAVINSNPTNNWYWNIGIWSPVLALTTGVMTNIEIDIQVQFTERFSLTT